MPKKQGKGTQLTFVSASGDVSGLCLIGTQASGQTVEMLDGVCMTSTEMEKVANELIDRGDESLTLFHDPTLDIGLLLGEKGVLTITSPKSIPASTTPESETGNAVMSSYAVGRQVGALMTSTVSFTWSGDGTYVKVIES